MNGWKRQTVQIRTADLFDWHNNKQIDMKPPYQRDSVWSGQNRSWFIWSLLNDMDVPKLYFHVKPKKRGPAIYDVVDGQQRLRALFDYLDGKFMIPRSSVKDTDILFAGDQKIGGLHAKQLPDELFNQLYNYQFDVVLIDAPDDSVAIRRQFILLQRGVALTPQEKREAFSSHLVLTADRLSKHPVLDKLFVQKGKGISQRRQLVARLFCWERRGKIVDTEKSILDGIYLDARFGGFGTGEIDELAGNINRVLDWCHVVLNQESHLSAIELLGLFAFLRFTLFETAMSKDDLRYLQRWHAQFWKSISDIDKKLFASRASRADVMTTYFKQAVASFEEWKRPISNNGHKTKVPEGI